MSNMCENTAFVTCSFFSFVICVQNTTENALQIMSLAAYASETKKAHFYKSKET